MNDWILRNVISSMKSRIKALEKNMNDEEVHKTYKSANKDEINWLRYELQEIENMMLEDVRDFEAAEENLREMRAYAYI